MATCTTVRVEVMNMSYDFLTFIVARVLHQLCTMLFPVLCRMLLPGSMQGVSCWFSYFLFCRARNVHWFGGIVVRGCASRSLLGSYVHQESILIK